MVGHAYLRAGFQLSDANRDMLLGRYHRAIELMDGKLSAFWERLETSGLLQDTVLIVVSDHGEAFGEHGLYFHDASTYDTHLHVPLWIHHPARGVEDVRDVVTATGLFDLARAEFLGEGLADTILDRTHRLENAYALAEHFHYPFTRNVLPRYVQNIRASIAGGHKVVASREGLALYDLIEDPTEQRGESVRGGDLPDLLAQVDLPAAARSRIARHLQTGDTM